MKARDVLVGAIVLGLLVGGALWVRKSRLDKQALIVTTPTVEEKIEKSFNGLTIPEGVEKVELNDVSGGDGFGVATRTEVLADLPNLTSGTYQIWMDGKNLGKMRVAKGGWIFEGRLGGKKIEVKLGTNTLLEGSF
ncbi:MAG: hypothetical protein AAB535_00770 [Patescibacteria group bacterium]